MIYDFKVKKTNGEEILLEKYKGKVLLIVNTASGCGFTPQYEGLQKIYDEYKDKGFENINLTTYGFQAPEFYKKCGFKVEFVRENKKNPKLNKYFLVKYF